MTQLRGFRGEYKNRGGFETTGSGSKVVVHSNLLRKGIREPSTLRDPMASQPQLRPASPGLQPGIFKDFASWPEHFDSRLERP